MPMTNRFTKTLAITGLIFTGLPLLAPLFLGMFSFVSGSGFRFDYLMPAELFPLALAGGGLLLWAALRARLYRRFIGGSLAASILLLLASQGLAVVTGLATGAAQPGGAAWGFVLGGLILFTLALVSTAIGGILLLRELYHPVPALT